MPEEIIKWSELVPLDLFDEVQKSATKAKEAIQEFEAAYIKLQERLKEL